jgi:hypothetical protein
VAMAGDQPKGVVPGAEIEQRQPQRPDNLEVAHSQEGFSFIVRGHLADLALQPRDLIVTAVALALPREWHP